MAGGRGYNIASGGQGGGCATNGRGRGYNIASGGQGGGCATNGRGEGGRCYIRLWGGRGWVVVRY